MKTLGERTAGYVPTVDGVVRGGLLAVAGAVSAAGLFSETGRLGIAVAVVGVVVAVATTGYYGIAVQHFGAVAVIETPSVDAIIALEAAALLLLAFEVPSGDRLEAGALFVPVAVTLAVGVVSVAQRWDFLVASTVLVGVVGCGVYFLHRYASVRLGATALEPNR